MLWNLLCHYNNIYTSSYKFFFLKKKSTNQWLEKKKKQWIVHIEQTKTTVAFTHSPNKCQNIFAKHLFSIVVGHKFVFYYFISN